MKVDVLLESSGRKVGVFDWKENVHPRNPPKIKRHSYIGLRNVDLHRNGCISPHVGFECKGPVRRDRTGPPYVFASPIGNWHTSPR